MTSNKNEQRAENTYAPNLSILWHHQRIIADAWNMFNSDQDLIMRKNIIVITKQCDGQIHLLILKA